MKNLSETIKKLQNAEKYNAMVTILNNTELAVIREIHDSLINSPNSNNRTIAEFCDDFLCLANMLASLNWENITLNNGYLRGNFNLAEGVKVGISIEVVGVTPYNYVKVITVDGVSTMYTAKSRIMESPTNTFFLPWAVQE